MSQFFWKGLYLGLFLCFRKYPEPYSENPHLMAVETLEDGLGGVGGCPLHFPVTVHVAVDADDRVGQLHCLLFALGDAAEDFPEGQRQVDVWKECGPEEHRRNLFGSISGDATADGRDEEAQLGVLTGERGEALNGRTEAVETLHRRDGVGLSLETLPYSPDGTETLLGSTGGPAQVPALEIAPLCKRLHKEAYVKSEIM